MGGARAYFVSPFAANPRKIRPREASVVPARSRVVFSATIGRMDCASPLASIFRSILAALPAVALSACSCPPSRVVVPISLSQIPPNASSSPTSRALTEDECRALCGVPTECHIVELCTGATPRACVNDVGFTQPDAGALEAGAPTRGWGVECTVGRQCIGGRRPEGFEIAPADERSVGAFLARQAALESASMPAFEQLAQRLAALDAPAELVARALDAVVDEFAHAAAMKRLAAREGATVPSYVQRPHAEASLEALATDNAVEGCVRETFAALLALHQSERGEEPSIREAFSSIAADETRHAELSRDVHRWAIAQLGRDARARVDAAMRAAIDELRRECGAPSMPERDRARLGLPDARAMSAMLTALDRALWKRPSLALS